MNKHYYHFQLSELLERLTALLATRRQLNINDVFVRYNARDFTFKPGFVAVIALCIRSNVTLPNKISPGIVTIVNEIISDYFQGVSDCNCPPSLKGYCERHAALQALARFDGERMS